MAVAAGCIVLLALVLDTNAIAAAITETTGWVLVAASFLMLVGLPFAALRWHMILQNLGVTMPRAESLRITCTSTMVALGLPSGQGGDIVRGVMLASRGNTRIETIVSSTIADRVFGLLSMALLALPGAIILATQIGGWVAALCAGLLAVLLLLILGIGPLERLLAWREGPIANRIKEGLAELRKIFRQRSIAAWAIAYSLAVHGHAVLAAWLLGADLAIQATAWDYLALVPLIWVITMVPVSIGGIGVREASFALLFSGIGVPPEQGAALGALVSVTSVLGVIAGGLLVLILPRSAPPG
ncbi:MAG: lysylphosphatidylglycerol synthase transmembrane domain-containing protein [Pseudomonadota bacterium]